MFYLAQPKCPKNKNSTNYFQKLKWTLLFFPVIIKSNNLFLSLWILINMIRAPLVSRKTNFATLTCKVSCLYEQMELRTCTQFWSLTIFGVRNNPWHFYRWVDDGSAKANPMNAERTLICFFKRANESRPALGFMIGEVVLPLRASVSSDTNWVSLWRTNVISWTYLFMMLVSLRLCHHSTSCVAFSGMAGAIL